MAYWIEGWIEITHCQDTKHVDEDGWASVLNLGTLIDGADFVSERLFGLSKRCTAKEFNAKALALSRGVPSHPSKELKAQLDDIAEFEKQHGPEDFGGHTYASWREIKTVVLESEALQESDWKIVFDFVRQLEARGHYRDDQIRFVLWFNW